MHRPISAPDFQENLDAVRLRIAEACQAAGRTPEEVQLLAVTKTHPVETMEVAWRAGLMRFGENRVQEAVPKMEGFSHPAEWELIGHLQSNKARMAVEHFSRIQSVDRLKLVQVLDRLVGEGSVRAPFPILLQVNAGDDPAKFGCSVDEAEALLQRAMESGRLRIDGLMTIAPLDQDREVARRCFERLRILRDRLRSRSGLALETLSMGMTGDLEEAIAEGSTVVRVGSALFGSRPAH